MLVNTNAMLQMSISQTIASQAATSARAGAAGAGASAARPPQCDLLPPPDLQRGADDHVPPELQGDPRYQAWLRCRQGQAAGAPPGSSSSAGGSPPGGWLNSPSHAGTPVATTGGHYPTPALQHHLPLGATDFKPAVSGHPFLEQYLRSQPFTSQQRSAVRQAFTEMSARLARAGRPNNLAVATAAAVCSAIHVLDARFTDADSERYLVAINDRLGASPQIAGMSPLQKQNLSESLILQSTVIALLSQEGQSDPRARGQSTEFAHTVLQQLTGSPAGRLSF